MKRILALSSGATAVLAAHPARPPARPDNRSSFVEYSDFDFFFRGGAGWADEDWEGVEVDDMAGVGVGDESSSVVVSRVLTVLPGRAPGWSISGWRPDRSTGGRRLSQGKQSPEMQNTVTPASVAEGAETRAAPEPCCRPPSFDSSDDDGDDR